MCLSVLVVALRVRGLLCDGGSQSWSGSGVEESWAQCQTGMESAVDIEAVRELTAETSSRQDSLGVVVDLAQGRRCCDVLVTIR